MAKQKIDRIRLTLDLIPSDMKKARKLKEMYDITSQAEAVRTAIRHDLALVEFVKAGDKIQRLKKDGTIETLAFIEWLQYMT
jgi:hypothetical protein